MAEFFQKRGKRHDDDMLGSAVNFLLANARLVLGVGGAAVLGIATLAVKRLIDRAASSQDKDDAKADATSLEDSWKELSLLKAAPRPQPRPSLAAPSQPMLLPVPSLFAPGEWHPFPSNLVGPPLVVTLRRCSPGSATDQLCPVQAPLPPGVWAPCMFHGVFFCPSVNHWDMWTLGVISQ
uniref:Mitochondrial elongation factor 2 n=1 Tax=Myotis myotis TaxID=51298 RepID=A0A7J7RDW7_MYOMY|nr:mitochondrial elongation factor 2 [Myotis myotis]